MLVHPFAKDPVTAQSNTSYEFSVKKDVWKCIERSQKTTWRMHIANEAADLEISNIDVLFRKKPAGWRV